MDLLYKIMSKNSKLLGKNSTEYGKGNFQNFGGCDDDDDDDEVDEDGFVIMKCYEKKTPNVVQCESLPSSPARICETDVLQYTTSCLPNKQPTPTYPSIATPTHSSILDVPMQLSKHFQIIQICQTLSVTKRTFLDLHMFNYDFKIEQSVLDDPN